MSVRQIPWTQEPTLWRGEFEGAEFGSNVSIIFNRIDLPGGGPELHRHPYSETFIVRRGTVVFSTGASSFEASAGEIVVIPAGIPHGFTSKTDDVEMVDIHASPTFLTEWLAQPAGPTGPGGQRDPGDGFVPIDKLPLDGMSQAGAFVPISKKMGAA